MSAFGFVAPIWFGMLLNVGISDAKVLRTKKGRGEIEPTVIYSSLGCFKVYNARHLPGGGANVRLFQAF